MLISELVAILFAIARQALHGHFLVDLAGGSLFLLWIGLTCSAVLCRTRDWLQRMPPSRAAWVAMAMLLATIGTYGVTARSVVERTREVGIRLALGGRPRDVWWTVARDSFGAVVAGAIGGVVLSLAAGAGLTALLPDAGGGIWKAAVGCAGGLVIVGAMVAMVAARRAVTVDPLVALKES